mmetsp:Transcript_95/g.221  ORF Transcript_95/g.221 Transcript_95/m.221 type:complete len:205 (-) Transcript_95:1266-1880(-)
MPGICLRLMMYVAGLKAWLAVEGGALPVQTLRCHSFRRHQYRSGIERRLHALSCAQNSRSHEHFQLVGNLRILQCSLSGRWVSFHLVEHLLDNGIAHDAANLWVLLSLFDPPLVNFPVIPALDSHHDLSLQVLQFLSLLLGRVLLHTGVHGLQSFVIAPQPEHLDSAFANVNLHEVWGHGHALLTVIYGIVPVHNLGINKCTVA